MNSSMQKRLMIIRFTVSCLHFETALKGSQSYCEVTSWPDNCSENKNDYTHLYVYAVKIDKW